MYFALGCANFEGHLVSYCFCSGTKRKQKQCLYKICGDKNNILVFSEVAYLYNLIYFGSPLQRIMICVLDSTIAFSKSNPCDSDLTAKQHYLNWTTGTDVFQAHKENRRGTKKRLKVVDLPEQPHRDWSLSCYRCLWRLSPSLHCPGCFATMCT